MNEFGGGGGITSSSMQLATMFIQKISLVLYQLSYNQPKNTSETYSSNILRNHTNGRVVNKELNAHKIQFIFSNIYLQNCFRNISYTHQNEFAVTSQTSAIIS